MAVQRSDALQKKRLPDFIGGALPSGTVNFAAYEISKTITVDVAGDAIVEPDESFTVTLSNPSTGAVLGTASASGTIQNDDASYISYEFHHLVF